MIDETYTTASAEEQGHEQTDSDCPWCDGSSRSATRRYHDCAWRSRDCDEPLYQGGEVRYCDECPFSAMYPKHLSDAAPHIIRSFADHMDEKRRSQYQ